MASWHLTEALSAESSPAKSLWIHEVFSSEQNLPGHQRRSELTGIFFDVAAHFPDQATVHLTMAVFKNLRVVQGILEQTFCRVNQWFMYFCEP